MLSGPKFAAASDHAKLLHILALCYAAEARTDGFVPAAVAGKLTKARPSQFKAAIEHLTSVQPGCTNPSWEQHEGGWILHDYDDPLYGNPMKADEEVRRVQKSRAGHEGGKKSAQARAAKYGTAQPLSSPAEADTEALASKHQHAPASGSASSDSPSQPPPAPEADPKLARAGAHAQPLPSLHPTSSPTTHGDVVTEVANGTTPAPVNKVAVGRLLDWLCVKHGWTTIIRTTFLREEPIAKSIASLGTPWSDLQQQLDAMWEQTDADDRPSSLAYFWTRLQDEAHARTKQQPPSHARTDEGVTKVKPTARGMSS
jgi:hypothetical protein